MLGYSVVESYPSVPILFHTLHLREQILICFIFQILSASRTQGNTRAGAYRGMCRMITFKIFPQNEILIITNFQGLLVTQTGEIEDNIPGVSVARVCISVSGLSPSFPLMF